MRLSKFLGCTGGLAACLILSACTQMEHKSDLPDKKPLAVLEPAAHTAKITKKWQVTAGDGTGKNDIKLLLTRSGSSLITADHSGNVIAINENSR